MMIKLYALEVMEGNIKWKEIPFSPIIKDQSRPIFVNSLKMTKCSMN